MERRSLVRAAGRFVASALAGGLLGACATPAREAGDGAIGFYQRHLGAQWAFHCDFQPSCSAFGREAIATYGFVPGALMTADRLMRDHDLSREDYPHDDQGRPIDPPGANALFGPRAEAEPPDQSDTDDEQAGFADDLFDRGEWERARIEYLRLLRRSPPEADATRSRERIALCLARLGRRFEALAEVDRLAPGAERERARALVLRELGLHEQALAAAEASGDALFAGLLALEADRPDVARLRFSNLLEPPREGLLARTGEFERLPDKSEWLAGSMSALLPGSGHVYAGRTEDGLVALLTNSILIGGTLAAIHNEEEVTAAALGFVAFGFYAGNVYGAVNAAARHDRDVRGAFHARTRGWLRQGGVTFSVAPDGDGGAVGLYLRF